MRDEHTKKRSLGAFYVQMTKKHHKRMTATLTHPVRGCMHPCVLFMCVHMYERIKKTGSIRAIMARPPFQIWGASQRLSESMDTHRGAG